MQKKKEAGINRVKNGSQVFYCLIRSFGYPLEKHFFPIQNQPQPMLKSTFSALLLFLFITSLNAQKTIEEWKQSLDTASTDRTKAVIIQNIAVLYNNVDMDSMMKYTRLMEPYAKMPEFSVLQKLVYQLKGSYFMQKSMNDSALHLFKQSLASAEAENDTINAAYAYLNMGAMYAATGQSSKSIEVLLKVVAYMDAMETPNILVEFNAYNNLGAAYQALRDYKEALNYHKRAYNVAFASDQVFYQAMSAENVGGGHMNLEQWDSALVMLEQSLTLFETLNLPYNIAEVQMKMGDVMMEMGDFKNGETTLEESLKFFADSEYTTPEGRVNNSLGNLAFKRGAYRKALGHHLKSLEKYRESGAVPDEVDLLNEIAQDYRKLGQFNKAFDFLQQQIEMKDTLFSQQTADAVSEMEVKYETEKTEKELAIQTAQVAEQEARIEQQELIRNVAIGGVVVLALVAFIIYRIKTRSNEQISAKNEELGKALTERESLLKEIHHRVKNNLQVIASLLYLQSDKTDDVSVKRLLEEGQGLVRSMALIHQKLYENEDLKHIPFDEYLKELVGEIKRTFGAKAEAVSLEIEANGIQFDVDTAVPLGLIINELSTNAFKYAYTEKMGGATFSVKLEQDEEGYQMTVSDNGKGMPDEALTAAQSSSLGLRLTRMLSDQLEGEYEFDNTQGTSFQLRFAV